MYSMPYLLKYLKSYYNIKTVQGLDFVVKMKYLKTLITAKEYMFCKLAATEDEADEKLYLELELAVVKFFEDCTTC